MPDGHAKQYNCFQTNFVFLFLFLIKLDIYLPCVCTCSVAQRCPFLRNPMDCSPSGSSVHEWSRQEYQSRLPFPTPGVLPDPGIESTSLMSSTFWGADSLPLSPLAILLLFIHLTTWVHIKYILLSKRSQTQKYTAFHHL